MKQLMDSYMIDICFTQKCDEINQIEKLTHKSTLNAPVIEVDQIGIHIIFCPSIEIKSLKFLFLIARLKLYHHQSDNSFTEQQKRVKGKK